MLGALGAAMGWFSPLLGRVFPGNAVSPNPAAPLCWVFCLCPREPVGPAGLYAQGLGRSCTCDPSQAARPLISQSTALGLSLGGPSDPAALDLILEGPAGAALGLSRRALGSAALGLWVGHLASAPSVHPPEVSGVGPQSANLGAGNRVSGEPGLLILHSQSRG